MTGWKSNKPVDPVIVGAESAIRLICTAACHHADAVRQACKQHNTPSELCEVIELMQEAVRLGMTDGVAGIRLAWESQDFDVDDVRRGRLEATLNGYEKLFPKDPKAEEQWGVLGHAAGFAALQVGANYACSNPETKLLNLFEIAHSTKSVHVARSASFIAATIATIESIRTMHVATTPQLWPQMLTLLMGDGLMTQTETRAVIQQALQSEDWSLAGHALVALVEHHQQMLGD